MRVAHVGNYKPDSPNGVDKTIVGLVRHLGAQKVEVEVWHPSRHVDRTVERCEDGIRIVDLPVSRTLKGICRFGEGVAGFLKSRVGPVDLLHFHSVFQQENLKLAHLGIPYVVTPNGGYDRLVLAGRNRVAKSIWMALWERPYLKRARLIQAVSAPELATIESLSLPTPVRFIPNGIDETVFHRAVEPPSRLNYFLFLGRLAIDQKGLDLLLEGYAKAFARLPTMPRLVLAGPDFRGGREQLAAFARKLGIAAQVAFPGAVQGEAKWGLLAGARLFVHTSRWEGMPFALLEALALGRPVLVTPATNLAADVGEAAAGVVVASEVDAIADGLLEAAALSDERLDRMGGNARSMAQAKFAWQNIARALSRDYRSIALR
ncbi:MAG: glycosyltransferase family 4 protein [Hyphomonadaceae bacterium]